jgi:hypothetical protein
MSSSLQHVIGRTFFFVASTQLGYRLSLKWKSSDNTGPFSLSPAPFLFIQWIERCHYAKRHFMPNILTKYTFSPFVLRHTNRSVSERGRILRLHSFIHLWFYKPFVWPWPPFQFFYLFTQSVGSLDEGSARRKAVTCTQENRSKK